MPKLAYDLIDFTLNQKPDNVATTFADMVNQELAARIDARRGELEQTMFDDNDTSSETETVDISDDEIEDFLDNLTDEERAELEQEIEDDNE